jgi:hypothetical protein
LLRCRESAKCWTCSRRILTAVKETCGRRESTGIHSCELFLTLWVALKCEVCLAIADLIITAATFLGNTEF